MPAGGADALLGGGATAPADVREVAGVEGPDRALSILRGGVEGVGLAPLSLCLGLVSATPFDGVAHRNQLDPGVAKADAEGGYGAIAGTKAVCDLTDDRDHGIRQGFVTEHR